MYLFFVPTISTAIYFFHPSYPYYPLSYLTSLGVPSILLHISRCSMYPTSRLGIPSNLSHKSRCSIYPLHYDWMLYLYYLWMIHHSCICFQITIPTVMHLYIRCRAYCQFNFKSMIFFFASFQLHFSFQSYPKSCDAPGCDVDCSHCHHPLHLFHGQVTLLILPATSNNSQKKKRSFSLVWVGRHRWTWSSN